MENNIFVEIVWSAEEYMAYKEAMSEYEGYNAVVGADNVTTYEVDGEEVYKVMLDEISALDLKDELYSYLLDEEVVCGCETYDYIRDMYDEVVEELRYARGIL